MPTIDGLNGAAAAQPQQQNATSLGDLDSQAFLRLLVAQMRHQDPMSPTDASAMLQQTSQFAQVETLQQVSALQQQLLGLTQASMASDLVGKEVVAQTPDGQVSGIVDGVRFATAGPVLDVGGTEVALHDATAIGAAPAPAAAPASSESGPQPAPEPAPEPDSTDRAGDEPSDPTA